jgi:hypothetical protein
MRRKSRAYIEHRLATVGWKGDPAFDDGAHAAIFAYTGGIPRKTNTLLDRVLLMGYLEELHAFGEAEIQTVISDINEEYELPDPLGDNAAPVNVASAAPARAANAHMSPKMIRTSTNHAATAASKCWTNA